MAKLSFSVSIKISKKDPSPADYKGFLDWLTQIQQDAFQVQDLDCGIGAGWPHGKSPTGSIDLSYEKGSISEANLTTIFNWVQAHIFDAVPNNAEYSTPTWGWSP